MLFIRSILLGPKQKNPCCQIIPANLFFLNNLLNLKIFSAKQKFGAQGPIYNYIAGRIKRKKQQGEGEMAAQAKSFFNWSTGILLFHRQVSIFLKGFLLIRISLPQSLDSRLGSFVCVRRIPSSCLLKNTQALKLRNPH